MSARPNPSARGMAAFTFVLLAGCAAVPDLGAAPQLAAPDSFATSQSFAGPVAEWPSDHWWEAYGDRQLNALVEEALAGSPTLSAAAARVRQAESVILSASSADSLRVSGDASVINSLQDLDTDGLPQSIADAVPDDWRTQASASLKVSKQLDFFGRNRANFAAATSRALAAQAEEAAARLEISAGVALYYAELVRLHADRASAEDTIRVREASAALVDQRLRSGLENEGRAHQAAAQISAARAQLAGIDGNIIRTRHALAAMMGKGPDRGLDIIMPESPVLRSTGLPADLALDLVGRRPDLVAARRYAEAAAQRINAERADFYPNVNLTAVVGIQSLGLDRLGGGDLSFVSAGPAVSLPIFDGGGVEADFRKARGEYDEAVAVYNQTLANALREVADAISDRRALEAQLVEARRALASSEAAYEIVRIRYQGGLSSYIDALTVEDQLVSLRRTVADLESRTFALDIALIRSLGGGFNQA